MVAIARRQASSALSTLLAPLRPSLFLQNYFQREWTIVRGPGHRVDLSLADVADLVSRAVLDARVDLVEVMAPGGEVLPLKLGLPQGTKRVLTIPNDT